MRFLGYEPSRCASRRTLLQHFLATGLFLGSGLVGAHSIATVTG